MTPLHRDPQVERGEFREVAVWICTGCFIDGFHWPLLNEVGEFIDQGIDFFFEDEPVKRNHRCPGTKQNFNRGIWHRSKMRLSLDRYAVLLSMKNVAQGAKATDVYLEDPLQDKEDDGS